MVHCASVVDVNVPLWWMLMSLSGGCQCASVVVASLCTRRSIILVTKLFSTASVCPSSEECVSVL